MLFFMEISSEDEKERVELFHLMNYSQSLGVILFLQQVQLLFLQFAEQNFAQEIFSVPCQAILTMDRIPGLHMILLHLICIIINHQLLSKIYEMDKFNK